MHRRCEIAKTVSPENLRDRSPDQKAENSAF